MASAGGSIESPEEYAQTAQDVRERRSARHRALPKNPYRPPPANDNRALIPLGPQSFPTLVEALAASKQAMNPAGADPTPNRTLAPGWMPFGARAKQDFPQGPPPPNLGYNSPGGPIGPWGSGRQRPPGGIGPPERRSPGGGSALPLDDIELFVIIHQLKLVFINLWETIKKFTLTMVSPTSDPGDFITGIGDTAKKFGEAIGPVMPVLGTLSYAVGEVTSSFGQLTKAIDGNVDRYKRYSPELALASGLARMQLTLGDLRRAQTIGPALVSYESRRAQLQERIEDAKVRFMIKILPVVEGGMALFEKVLPYIENMADVLALIANATGLSADGTDSMVRLLKSLQREGLSDATSALLKGYVGPESAAERAARVRRGETGGVVTPDI